MTFFPVLTAKQRTEEIKHRQEKTRRYVKTDKEIARAREDWPVIRRTLYKIVSNPIFEGVCGVIILINMCLVVLETDAGVDDGLPDAWVVMSTNVLLGIYTTELVTKMFVYRLAFFSEMWNVLDFLIVGVDLVFIFIAFVVDGLPNLSVLRIFRLVRLARAFKAAKSLHELHSLLRACACALKAIFWGMVMMGLTLTVWGILAVQLIHPVNKEVAETKPHLYKDCDRCPRAFSTVFDSVVTIWKQIVAGDSWGQLCEPIIEHEAWTFIFFVLVLVTVALTMLNCILAVVVEAGAAAAAADEHDKAIQQEKVVTRAEEKLVGLCHELDADDSGSLSIEEFLTGFQENDDFRECLEVMHVTEDDMFMIFNICDEDDSGDVDYKEFVDQLRRIKHSGEQMLLHYVTDIRHVCNKIGHHLQIPLLTEQERGVASQLEGEGEAQAKFLQNITVQAEVKREQNGKEEQELGISGAGEEIQTDLAVASGATDALDGRQMDTDKIRGITKAIGNRPRQVADAPQGGRSTDPSSRDFLCQEQLDRLYQINENIVATLSDVAKQSKVHSVLLNTLVGSSPTGPGGAARIAGLGPYTPRMRRPDNSADRENVVQPGAPPNALGQSVIETADDVGRGVGRGGVIPLAQPRNVDAMLIKEGTDRTTSSACCARLV